MLLVYLMVGLFCALFFVQVYFRIKVLQVYKKLVKKGIDLNKIPIFNKAALQEIYARDPENAPDIKEFITQIKFSVFGAMGILFFMVILYFVMR